MTRLPASLLSAAIACSPAASADWLVQWVPPLASEAGAAMDGSFLRYEVEIADADGRIVSFTESMRPEMAVQEPGTLQPGMAYMVSIRTVLGSVKSDATRFVFTYQPSTIDPIPRPKPPTDVRIHWIPAGYDP